MSQYDVVQNPQGGWLPQPDLGEVDPANKAIASAETGKRIVLISPYQAINEWFKNKLPQIDSRFYLDSIDHVNAFDNRVVTVREVESRERSLGNRLHAIFDFGSIISPSSSSANGFRGKNLIDFDSYQIWWRQDGNDIKYLQLKEHIARGLKGQTETKAIHNVTFGNYPYLQRDLIFALTKDKKKLYNFERLNS